MFNKILISNRGEIAMRIIRTCKEMGIKTVAIYSTADKDSLHVKYADEAICIGPPNAKESYLNIPRIMSAVEITNSDAIHPGYGFLAENAEFSDVCAFSKLKFIGPSSDMIQKMGDKETARSLMKKVGVPIIPGSDGLVENEEEALEVSKKIGYPVIIKSTAGGGGKGMRIVHKSSDIKNAYVNARNEADSAFGNSGVYIEKYIENPRHIEIQILGDSHGKIVHLGERDCTIQRRHQKLIEESPSPVVDSVMRQKMGKVGLMAAHAINYEGAGTIEFLVDAHKNFFFIEMNTRIQVEHTVTEEIFDTDMVKQQINIASGKKIKLRQTKQSKGHSIECRINAEDPDNNFMPCPGRIEVFHVPGGQGVRIETHCYAGYNVPSYYDSLVAKLIVRASNRDEAILRMLRALDEFVIVGIKTTIPFYKKVFLMDDFRAGNYDTSFIEKLKL